LNVFLPLLRMYFLKETVINIKYKRERKKKHKTQKQKVLSVKI